MTVLLRGEARQEVVQASLFPAPKVLGPLVHILHCNILITAAPPSSGALSFFSSFLQTFCAENSLYFLLSPQLIASKKLALIQVLPVEQTCSLTDMNSQQNKQARDLHMPSVLGYLLLLSRVMSLIWESSSLCPLFTTQFSFGLLQTICQAFCAADRSIDWHGDSLLCTCTGLSLISMQKKLPSIRLREGMLEKYIYEE